MEQALTQLTLFFLTSSLVIQFAVFALLFSPPPTVGIVVTQIWGHIAGSPPPSPLKGIHFFVSYTACVNQNKTGELYLYGPRARFVRKRDLLELLLPGVLLPAHGARHLPLLRNKQVPFYTTGEAEYTPYS